MTVPYDIELRKLALDTAKELNMTDFVKEGVYLCISGPSYETPTESRLARLIGADTIGMSTAPEAVVARHCGMRVLGEDESATTVADVYDRAVLFLHIV